MVLQKKRRVSGQISLGINPLNPMQSHEIPLKSIEILYIWVNDYL